MRRYRETDAGLSDPPKALTPPRLPWPGRTIEEAMPDFLKKRNNGLPPKAGKGSK